jgi:hypothetical protein
VRFFRESLVRCCYTGTSLFLFDILRLQRSSWLWVTSQDIMCLKLADTYLAVTNKWGVSSIIYREASQSISSVLIQSKMTWKKQIIWYSTPLDFRAINYWENKNMFPMKMYTNSYLLYCPSHFSWTASEVGGWARMSIYRIVKSYHLPRPRTRQSWDHYGPLIFTNISAPD